MEAQHAGCLVVLLAFYALVVLSLVWAISDITSTPIQHKVGDIIVFVIVGLLVFGRSVKAA